MKVCTVRNPHNHSAMTQGHTRKSLKFKIAIDKAATIRRYSSNQNTNLQRGKSSRPIRNQHPKRSKSTLSHINKSVRRGNKTKWTWAPMRTRGGHRNQRLSNLSTPTASRIALPLALVMPYRTVGCRSRGLKYEPTRCLWLKLLISNRKGIDFSSLILLLKWSLHWSRKIQCLRSCCNNHSKNL